MHQAECVTFLRWAMPRLGLDWPGFQHCRHQVCKRLHRRIAELGLADFAAYRGYTLDHDTEWPVIDTCCRVTVSRFYRDKDVFDHLASEVLPRLAAAVDTRGGTKLRVWSAGCGAGEEPYSIALAWQFVVALRFPRVSPEIVATDVDDAQLARARSGCYRRSSLRELPAAWVNTAFVPSGPRYCLRPEYRAGVEFQRKDVRADAPKGPFDLILCRNLAFTYFDDAQQREVLAVILRELAAGGFIVIGRRERLPADAGGVSSWSPNLRIFAKTMVMPAQERAAD
jgi:chemotaxis protein methyltransferase CheR